MLFRLRRHRSVFALASLWVLLVQFSIGLVQVSGSVSAESVFGINQICTANGLVEVDGVQSDPVGNPLSANHDCGLCSVLCAAGGCSVTVQEFIQPARLLPPAINVPFAYANDVGMGAPHFTKSYPRAPPVAV